MLASRGVSNITRKAYIGSSRILGSICIPMQRPFPSIMSFFLFEKGFRPYVDHHRSIGGSKDMDSNLISLHAVFLLECVFFSSNKTTHKPTHKHKHTHTHTNCGPGYTSMNVGTSTLLSCLPKKKVLDRVDRGIIQKTICTPSRKLQEN